MSSGKYYYEEEKRSYTSNGPDHNGGVYGERVGAGELDIRFA
jgi:hypothetical protein